jgi:hypothetical protein
MYHLDTQPPFCFHEYCLLAVIISCIWDVTIILLVFWSQWWLINIHIGKSLINGATEVTQHHLCGYGHPAFWLHCAFQPLLCSRNSYRNCQ